MRLKKTWVSYCVWLLYCIFNISLLALSGYFSGLFPSQNRFIFTGAFTLLVSGGIAILTFLCWHLFDYFYQREFSKKPLFRVFDIITVLLTFGGGILYRIYILRQNTAGIDGDTWLYEKSVLTLENNPISHANILNFIYEHVLRFILTFTGNNEYIACLYQIGLQTVAILLVYFAVRMFNGVAGALCFAIYMEFMPLYTEKMHLLSNAYVFYVLFGLELFLASAFLKGACIDLYKNKVSYIWMLFVGAFMGFMLYVDAGTGMVFVMVIAVISTVKGKLKNKLIDILVVSVGAVISFILMLAQYAGVSNVLITFNEWINTYLHNLDKISIFTVYSQYREYYLVTFIFMIIAATGFLKWRKYQCSSPWLFMCVAVTVFIPFLGPTVLNCEEMATLFYAIVIGCGVSCIFFDPLVGEEDMVVENQIEKDSETKLDLDEESEESKAVIEQSSMVVKPDSKGNEDGLEIISEGTDSESNVVSEENNTELEAEAKIIEENTEEAEAKEIEENTEEAEAKEIDENEEAEVIEENTEQIIEASEKELEVVETVDDEASEEVASSMIIENRPEESEVIKIDLEKEREKRQKFIPEGMVLPIGDEDLMDVKPNIKLPGLEDIGTIELDKHKTHELDNVLKSGFDDDFDIDITPGDDFDI
ncbi:MAG: glycosyltransferase family 39 protein [Butyrivibrio sp.]|nr:glycosyltransferase family 39 protein [Butyrivibrio sp.]